MEQSFTPYQDRVLREIASADRGLTFMELEGVLEETDPGGLLRTIKFLEGHGFVSHSRHIPLYGVYRYRATPTGMEATLLACQ